MKIIVVNNSGSTIDLALLLRSEKSTVTISLTVSRNASLNNKWQKLNSRFINMSGERSVTFIDLSDIIDIRRHFYKYKINLNKPFCCSRIDIAPMLVLVNPKETKRV